MNVSHAFNFMFSSYSHTHNPLQHYSMPVTYIVCVTQITGAHVCTGDWRVTYSPLIYSWSHQK